MPKRVVLGSLLLILFGFFSMATLQIMAEREIPQSTLYGFPTPYLMDYFQYISMVKTGQEGSLLFLNQYSEEYFPPLFLQPHYHLLGLSTKALGLSPFHAYALARYIALFLFLFATTVLMHILVPNKKTFWISILLFLSATSTWTIITIQGMPMLEEPDAYSHWFNVLRKMTMIPPHHYLAVILLMFLLFHTILHKQTKRALILQTTGALLLSHLHPYVSVFFCYAVVVYCVIKTILIRRIDYFLFLLTGCALAASGSGIVYLRYLLTDIWGGQTTAAGGTLEWVPPIVAFPTYIRSLGPLLIPAGILLFDKKTYTNPIRIMLFLWALLPVAVFYLPDVGIPTGSLRLFQVYQHLPLAILAALGIASVSSRRYLSWLAPIITAAFVIFAIPSYTLSIHLYGSARNPYFRTFRLVSLSRGVFSYLQTNTPYRSVVLTGEELGMMIPAFTHNTVILGHVGNNRRYPEKKAEIQPFFYGTMPKEQLSAFVTRYAIDYIVFGLDSIEFERSPYYGNPLFTEVYREKTIAIVKVNKKQ